MRVLRLAWLGIRTEAADAMVEFLGSTLGLQLDHADDNGSVFVLPGGGKVEVDGPQIGELAVRDRATLAIAGPRITRSAVLSGMQSPRSHA